MFLETRSVLEPAGALALAGLKRYVEREGLSGRSLVAITSGANMNFDRMRFVADRADVGEARARRPSPSRAAGRARQLPPRAAPIGSAT